MKTYNLAISIALVCALLISCDSGSDRDIAEETQESVAETEQRMNEGKEEIQQEYNTFRENADEEIAANEERITQLKQEMENAEGEVRQRNKERINELEERNDSLRTELDEFQLETREDWESFKEGFNNTLDDIGNSIEELFSDEDI